MLEKVRDEFNNLIDIVNDLNLAIDNAEAEENDTTRIKSLDNFINRLKLDNLYSKELEEFIENYLKFYND